MKRLMRYSKSGFGLYVGKKMPIRSETSYEGVFRIGHGDSLFRLAGFFESEGGEDFFVMDAYEKHGQKLDASERKRLAEIAKIKRDGSWVKTDEDGEEEEAREEIPDEKR